MVSVQESKATLNEEKRSPGGASETAEGEDKLLGEIKPEAKISSHEKNQLDYSLPHLI